MLFRSREREGEGEREREGYLPAEGRWRGGAVRGAATSTLADREVRRRRWEGRLAVAHGDSDRGRGAEEGAAGRWRCGGRPVGGGAVAARGAGRLGEETESRTGARLGFGGLKKKHLTVDFRLRASIFAVYFR